MLAIECRDLRKTYAGKPPVEAVRGLDLAVEAGECFGLLGPNGAGKTTTIEILEGLLAATSGFVQILGQQWGRHDQELRERIGVSLQETKLVEKLTVWETVVLFRSFYAQGLDPRIVLAQLDLTEKSDSWVKKLSGGQRQRLAVACAIVGDPELLFLDEPTTGLDPQSRRQLWDIIRGYRVSGRTVLLTTHYMDEAERLCDRVAIVDAGRVIACDTPRQLIASLGGEHVIELTLENGRDHGDVAQRFEGLASVSGVRQDGDHFLLTVEEPHVALPALIGRLETSGLKLASLTTRHASLEDVFVALTGRHLTDDEHSDAAEAKSA